MDIISNAILNATLNEKLHATSNATFEESIDYYESSRQQFETWQLALWGTLASVTSLAIVAANVIVIVAFVVKRVVREAVNYYMVSLAFGGIITGLVLLPSSTIVLLNRDQWPLGQHTCHVWLSLEYTVNIAFTFNMLIIAIDQCCCCILPPATYRVWFTTPKVVAIVIITWALPALIFFITIFGWRYFDNEAPQNDSNTGCYPPFNQHVVLNVVIHCFVYWSALYIMCCFYVIIFYKAVVEMNPNPKDGAQSISNPGNVQTTTAPNYAEEKPLFSRSLYTDPTLTSKHVQNSIELVSSKAEDRYTCEPTAQVLPDNNHENQWSQQRARRALVITTLILGAFVVCWTPWWMVQATLHFFLTMNAYWTAGGAFKQQYVINATNYLYYLFSLVNPLLVLLSARILNKHIFEC